MPLATKTTTSDHVILCGLGQLGWQVFEQLRQTGWPLVVVDTRCEADDPRLADVRLIKGDCRQKTVLEAAGIATATGILILTSSDLVNLTTALTARSLKPGLRVVARFFNQTILSRLSKAVPDVQAVSKSALTAPLFALTALSGETLGTFATAQGQREILELKLGPEHPLLGQKVGAVAQRFRVAPLAHERNDDAAGCRFLHEVDSEATLTEGDRLVVCGLDGEVAKLSALAAEEGSMPLRWANFFRRQTRGVARALAEIDLPVKVILTLFLLVMAGSALIFHFYFNRGWAEGMYRTISVMSTAADMKADPAEQQLQVFVVILRLCGIVLTAALTALLTNYLVRARLGGAFTASRIPDSGHIVVCGLGNIGIRIVEELRRRQASVVAIEKSRESSFAAEARRLGATVLFGDASQKPTLLKAHAAKARAVIAATSDDLVNIEITLMARDLNERQRVVLRLDDPLLATALKTAAPIRYALAVPALAAPAIVAALYQDRLLCLFTCFRQVLVAVEVTVDPQGEASWVGQTVRALSIDFGFVAVEARTTERPLLSQEILNHRLAAGDRLTLLTKMTNLERCLRQESANKEWAVDVTHYPLPMKDWLAQLYRTLNGCTGADAATAVERTPLRLANQLTRGQAEDLLILLRRERIQGQSLRDQAL